MDTAIGQRIKAAREAAHLTQEELAKAVGCTTKHIGAIERGVKTPSLEAFIIIANTLGVTADELLQDELLYLKDPFASEFASAVAPLPLDLKRRVLRAVKAFSEERER